MGGSLAMVLKQNRLCRKVVALVRRESAVEQALTLGVVDEAVTDPAVALAQADVVIFATPVRVLLRQLTEFAPFYKSGAIITDLGSTKQAITQVMATLPHTVYPIGSHPMCGKETAGLAVAEVSLYQNAPWILTPLDRTPQHITDYMTEFAQAIGAYPRIIKAKRHDRLVATISHVPYILSTTLVHTGQAVAKTDPTVWDVAASGFRDTSRIAASDETMLLDILLTNQEMVLDILDTFTDQLQQFRTALTKRDETQLRALMNQAATQRRSMYQ